MEKQKLPHSQNALILGISSIVTACCCYGILGAILGFIALNSAKKAKAIYEEDPESYTGMDNAETGRITGIIGIAIGLLLTIVYIIVIATVGMAGYWELLEEFKHFN